MNEVNIFYSLSLTGYQARAKAQGQYKTQTRDFVVVNVLTLFAVDIPCGL